ncbi:tumor necrosis factor alpha-induced protein 3 isoform X1 [Anopheles sinensis]|uniref:Tumor necrosis factor alpha-induced protein 3 isoform X1 n=1 Tax=Anopheles sinensis TaxID=74873 RepID=A0A084WCE9_ANOSI|nr:tumor necrosis factor alpha-induced protein 3 isoform X1 [Anopheles sinensis]
MSYVWPGLLPLSDKDPGPVQASRNVEMCQKRVSRAVGFLGRPTPLQRLQATPRDYPCSVSRGFAFCLQTSCSVLASSTVLPRNMFQGGASFASSVVSRFPEPRDGGNK